MERYVRSALVAVLASAPVLSMAAGQITFNGRVNDQTCQITVDGQDNPTVTLPTVPESQLPSLGATAGLTAFTVRIAACKSDNSALSVNMLLWGAPVTGNGNLQNTASVSPASNVEIQLMADAAGTTPITLTATSAVPGLTLPANAQEALHTFAARYFATGQAQAGNVQAIVNYDVGYL